MASNRAVVVDRHASGRLTLAGVPIPRPAPSQALIRVEAISLNLGEVRRVLSAEDGWRPGWDLAGTVEAAAEDGSGPQGGTRVVGVVDSGAWAELVAVPTNRLAMLPDTVSFAQAATLPIAGLTALRSLERGGLLLDRSVLVMGASGGVGHLAIQLASRAGAQVVGIVRRRKRVEDVLRRGASQVFLEDKLSDASTYGPYALVLESVGGVVFKRVMTMLAPGGTCVMYGTSAGPRLSFDGAFHVKGGTTLYGFMIFYEMTHDPPADDLARLARMVAAGWLRPAVNLEATWTEIASVAQQFLDRQVSGKAVLHIAR